MSENKTSILLSDVSIEGDIVEKDKIIIDAKINGNIKSDEVQTHSNSNITGNIKSKRDWGHAKDYVKMQWMMMQQKTFYITVLQEENEEKMEKWQPKGTRKTRRKRQTHSSKFIRAKELLIRINNIKRER